MTLVQALIHHNPEGAHEANDLEQILAFIRRHPDPFDRRITEGHLTASTLIISDSGDHVFFLYHRKLRRWLQPGGHAEPGETSGEIVALREAREETGLSGLIFHPTAQRPLDVDVHDIPAGWGEPAHQHLDLRYLLVAPNQACSAGLTGEATNQGWFSWSELTRLSLDVGLNRALNKIRRILNR